MVRLLKRVVFQIRFTGNPSESGADKTINFKSSDLLPPPMAITLLDLKTTSSDLARIPLVLAGSALVLATSLFVLRRKVYVKPQILHEIDLETRAGSPTNLGDPFHVLDIDAN